MAWCMRCLSQRKANKVTGASSDLSGENSSELNVVVSSLKLLRVTRVFDCCGSFFSDAANDTKPRLAFRSVTQSPTASGGIRPVIVAEIKHSV
jgi:hypothetical protein